MQGTSRFAGARLVSVLCLVAGTAVAIALTAAGTSGPARHTPKGSMPAVSTPKRSAPENSMPAVSAPKVAAGTTGYLIGISCTSPSACTAVGHYGKAAPGAVPAPEPVRPLAESWNGTRWAAESPPSPPGAAAPGGAGASLTAVSCSSASTCMAIGSYTKGLTAVPLTESRNGTRWTIRPSPGPPGATGRALAGVSCTSASACTAVGSYTKSPGGSAAPNAPGTLALAQSWDGTRWTLEPLPYPAGASGSDLTAVSCTSPTACAAVGGILYDKNPSKPSVRALAESWDGTRWTARPVPEPAGAGSAVLTAVSCASATTCTAIGYVARSQGVVPLAESWDGTRWTTGPSPALAGALSLGLANLSCTSPRSCLAVGDYTTKTSTMPAAQAWDGTTWATRSPLNPPRATSTSLIGISCTSATACTAVGRSTGALAETWNGKTWTVQPLPLP